jgi:hypothetical protein
MTSRSGACSASRRAPWSGQTPPDAARDSRQRAVVAWLTESGATAG